MKTKDKIRRFLAINGVQIEGGSGPLSENERNQFRMLVCTRYSVTSEHAETSFVFLGVLPVTAIQAIELACQESVPEIAVQSEVSVTNADLESKTILPELEVPVTLDATVVEAEIQSSFTEQPAEPEQPSDVVEESQVSALEEVMAAEDQPAADAPEVPELQPEEVVEVVASKPQTEEATMSEVVEEVVEELAEETVEEPAAEEKAVAPTSKKKKGR
jgi:hypothetical protein